MAGAIGRIAGISTISSAVGEALVEKLAIQIFGTEDYVARNIAGFMGSVSGGALAGACIAGPVGAAGGVAVGAVSHVIGKGVGALINSGFGIEVRIVKYFSLIN